MSAAAPDNEADGRERALRGLELTVRRRLDGLLHGDHRGLRTGPGSEPDEARPYRPGVDDVRRMDWNITARSIEPHVRVPAAERELEAWVLVDGSASMDFGTTEREKRDLGRAVVATVGLLAARPGNRMGVRIAFGGELLRIQALPGPAATRRAVRRLFALPRLAPEERPVTDLGAAITRLRRDHPRPGLRVIASDFLDPNPASGEPDWQTPLRRLAARHDVIAVEIVDPRDLELPDIGGLTLVDPETGQTCEVHTGRRLRERFAAAAAEHRQQVQAALRAAGVAHLRLRTDRDWVRDVAAFTKARRRAWVHRAPVARGAVR